MRAEHKVRNERVVGRCLVIYKIAVKKPADYEVYKRSLDVYCEYRQSVGPGSQSALPDEVRFRMGRGNIILAAMLCVIIGANVDEEEVVELLVAVDRAILRLCEQQADISA